MQELPYDTEEPIAALATPWGESALAVIRTAGNGCVELVSGLFSAGETLRNAESGTMHYGLIRDPESGETVDQVVAAVFRPPHGYTGQESVEISCHGSLPGIQRILELLRRAGFRDAAAGEFTLRAFLNGKMDLTRAEAVGEIVSAKSRKAQNLALGRLSGNVWRRIDEAKQRLTKLLSSVEVQLDYPEDELESPPELDTSELAGVKQRVEELAAGYRTGRIYQEGALVAITGPTNAGKSSLFNLFLREDRSIVSEVHGTTRDYIESWISIRGIPVRLVDTAGLREAEHPVEQEGIRRSERVIESASLVLYLLDGAEGPAEEQLEFCRNREQDERFIFLLNKADLADRGAADKRSETAVGRGSADMGAERGAASPGKTDWFSISAVTGQGFAELEEEIGRRLLGADSGEGELYIDSRRQFDLLQRASSALAEAQSGVDNDVPLDFVAADLRDAVDSLGEITGEVTSADILGRIFSDFCVGK